MIAQYEKDTGETVSHDTVERALRDMGYSYKRGKKAVPANAPNKEEKLKRVKEICREIESLGSSGDYEIMFLDESHFTTDPYVSRGWHKRGQPFFPQGSEKERKHNNIWGIRTGKRYILLQEYEEK